MTATAEPALSRDGISALDIERLEPSVDDVQRLLDAQAPHFADLSISSFAQGWDNAMFLLGEEYVARLPRHEAAAALLHKEIRWLPELAPSLPLEVPTPIFEGESDEGFPWPWSIARRLPGWSPVAVGDIDNEVSALRLAGFCDALHRPAPDDAPFNPVRSVSIAERSERFDRDLGVVTESGSLPSSVDPADLQRLWASVCEQSIAPPRRWIHGDFHPGNLLGHGGLVSAVVDFGDLGWGDPACDLGVAWYVFGESARSSFFGGLVEVDAGTILRSRGWAIAFSLAILANAALSPWLVPIAGHALVTAVRG